VGASGGPRAMLTAEWDDGEQLLARTIRNGPHVTGTVRVTGTRMGAVNERGVHVDLHGVTLLRDEAGSGGPRAFEPIAGDPALIGYPQLPAVRASFVKRLARTEEHDDEFERARGNVPERRRAACT
jgi:hypothetical protein